MAFESMLNPIFSPLLRLPVWLSLFIISGLMSLLVTLIYKWMTDQKMMKQLKDEMKEMQKKIKEVSKNPEKALALQKQAMESNMKYMMQSMKPTLITFIPVILIFGWLNSALAYYPIMPNTPFTTTAFFNNGIEGTATIQVPERLTIISNATQKIVNGQATWIAKGPSGDYFLSYDYGGEKKQKNLIISDSNKYAAIEERYSNSPFKSIRLNNNPIHPFGSFSIFGWMPGWLGTYIIFSLIVSIILRKVLKVY